MDGPVLSAEPADEPPIGVGTHDQADEPYRVSGDPLYSLSQEAGAGEVHRALVVRGLPVMTHEPRIERIPMLEQRGVGFRSLTESMDTTTSGGRLIFHVFGALAEFERAVIRERTLAGLVAARARGRCGGRPKSMHATQIAMAKAMLADRELPVRKVYEALHVSRATLYRHLSADRAALGGRAVQRPRSRAFRRRPEPDTRARDVSL